jgi:hypothetical protein
VAQIEIIPESIKLIKMDDAEYFSEKYKDYISNSKLSLINPDEGGSKEKYMTGFASSYSESFELGSALHAMILQPDLFYISQFKKPSGKLGIFIEKIFEFRNKGLSIQDSIDNASEAADYYKGKLSKTRLTTALKAGINYYFYLWKEFSVEKEVHGSKTPIYLSASIHNKYIECMSNALVNDDILSFMGLGINSYNEYAIFCEVNVTLDSGEEVIIKLKGKLDNFVIDDENSTLILNDLKTTSKPVSFFMGNNVRIMEDDKKYWKWFDGSFQKYRYYRQMAMYLWLLQCAMQALHGIMYSSKGNMVVIETTPNFESKVYPVSNGDIRKGLAEMKKLLIYIAEWKIQDLKK